MKKRSERRGETSAELRAKIIGLGERSTRKSYYPELRRRLAELERFRALLDRSNDAVLVIDADHRRVVDVNDTACRLLGASRAELLGRPDDQLASLLLNDAPAEGRSITRLRSRDGREIPVEVTLSFIDFGAARFALAVARDVSERLRAEAAMREADRRKDEFLAMLGHELRNPLTPIRNAIQILRRSGPLNAQQERAGDLIERQSQHLARLVDDLLDVSRITRGLIQLRQSSLDLGDLALAAVEDQRAAFEASQLLLSVNRSGHRLPVHGDPVRLTQVLDNILGNARKFTAEGGRISVEVGPVPDGTARIVVSDTGIGIAPEALPALFQPFMQADRTLARSYGGLGLGLAVAHNIVELHGGTIEASSEGVGRGARFEIRLPLRREEREPLEIPAAPCTSTSVERRRVLVVDDDLDAAETIRLLLEQAGHLVVEAHDGKSGVATAERFHPQVVLCDIGLPGGVDGHDVARALRANPEMHSVRLVALTGYGGPEERRRALEAGFDGHVTKPADPETLCNLVATEWVS